MVCDDILASTGPSSGTFLADNEIYCAILNSCPRPFSVGLEDGWLNKRELIVRRDGVSWVAEAQESA
jgi:hypothetical protein